MAGVSLRRAVARLARPHFWFLVVERMTFSCGAGISFEGLQVKGCSDNDPVHDPGGTMWDVIIYGALWSRGGSVVIHSLIGSVLLSICVFSNAATLVHGAENFSERDWAGLQHYRIANAKTAPPAKEEKRVVFFGDSITEMWNLRDHFRRSVH